MGRMRLKRAFTPPAIVVAVLLVLVLVPSATAQNTPDDLNALLRDLVEFGIDAAGASGTVDVVAPTDIGGPVHILFDVPSSIEVPLALVSTFARPPGAVTAADFTNGSTSSTHLALPLQVCVQFEVEGDAAVGTPQVATPESPVDGGKAGLSPDTETELSEQGLSCPEEWAPVTAAATLVAATVPLPAPAPLELSPASLPDLVGDVTEDVTITARLLIQTKLPGDDGPVVSKEFDAPPVTVPVPQLPIPDVGFGFGGKNYGRHDNWFGLLISVPAGSALGSVAEAFELVSRLQDIVNDARQTLDTVIFVTPVNKADVLGMYDELTGAFDQVLSQESLPEGAEWAGVAFYEGNEDNPSGDGWVDRRGGLTGQDDPGLDDDVRSAILFAPSHIWCWYMDSEFNGDEGDEPDPEDYALHAYAAAPFVRLYPDVEEEFGPNFEGTGVAGGTEGMSSWQWFRRDDRTGFQTGLFPVTRENEARACRSGGHDRQPVSQANR